MCTRIFKYANSRSFLASPNQCDPGASLSKTIGIQGIQEDELASSKKDSECSLLLRRSYDTRSFRTKSAWEFFGKCSGGKGGRVSRGGANPELQGLPLQGEMAHEVVSGGSYSASKRTQSPTHGSSSFWHHLNPQCNQSSRSDLKLVWSACHRV